MHLTRRAHARHRREQDKEHHEAAQQKERQQRREWEARCDDHVRDKREQAKRHAEELRSQVGKDVRQVGGREEGREGGRGKEPKTTNECSFQVVV